MSEKVLVMTKNKWLDLRNHGQYISGLALVERLDRAMTEVDLSEMLLVPTSREENTFQGGLEAAYDYLLAHMEGQHGK